MSALAGSPRAPQSVRSTDSTPPHVTQVRVTSDDRKTGTSNLAQRLLATNPSTPLPPLFPTPTPDHARLNDQIYHFLALALRAFVLTWWSKLTPRDREFLPQITAVIRHVVRKVHQRLQRAELVQLILVSIPVLVKQHYADYKHAERKLGSSYANLPPSAIHHVFHRLQPHIGVHLQDEGEDVAPTVPSRPPLDPIYLTACVDLLLKECLPPEDSQSEMERSIVREIIVGPVLGGALPKLAQPWFIINILLDVLGPPKSATEDRPTIDPQRPSSSSTFRSLVVVFFTTIQTISTFCLNLIHLSQSLVQLANSVNASSDQANRKPPITSSRQALLQLFWPSSPGERQGQNSGNSQRTLVDPSIKLLREVLDLGEDSRKDMVASSILTSLHFVSGFAEPFLDQLLPYILKTKILTINTASTIVTAATRTLFPDSNNGYPAPTPPIPSAEEQTQLRDKLEARLRELIPSVLAGPSTPARILDPLSSAECNIHLVILILDLILVTIFPEFASGGHAAAASEEMVGVGDTDDMYSDATG